MEILKIGFLTIRLLDIIDIAIVSVIIYELREIFRKNVSNQLVAVVLLIAVIWKIVDYMELKMLKTFLDAFVGLGSLALVVIFAPEIRKVLLNLSSRTWVNSLFRITTDKKEIDYHSIIEAVFEMANSKTGASIVIKASNDLLDIEKTGEAINATYTKRLLTSIFNKTSPLHDGAVIIDGNKITSVRCILPVSDSTTLPSEMGLRHRSALGLSEVSDAFVIVVSEERGKVSTIHQRKIMTELHQDDLLDQLLIFYKTGSVPFESTKIAKKSAPRRLS